MNGKGETKIKTDRAEGISRQIGPKACGSRGR